MAKRIFFIMLLPFVMVPALILLLKVSGLWGMGERLFFNFGMVCYMLGTLVGCWISASPFGRKSSN